MVSSSPWRWTYCEARRIASSKRFMFDSVATSALCRRATSGRRRTSSSASASAGSQSRFWKKASNKSSLASRSSGRVTTIAQSRTMASSFLPARSSARIGSCGSAGAGCGVAAPAASEVIAGRRSRTLVGIVIKLADDAGQSRFRLLQMIAAVAVAAEAAVLAQFVERAGDFAAVLGAERLDDIGIEHRRRAERLLDGLVARRPPEDLGRGAGERNLAVAAERLCAIEAGFGAGAPAVERRVHGHAEHALQDDEVLVGLEAGAERPIHLAVVVDVDVLVEHIDVLQAHDAAKQRRDRRARFAKTALLDGHPQRVGAARNAAQIDRDRLAHGGFEDAHGFGLGAHRRDVGAVGLVEHEGRAVQQGVM